MTILEETYWEKANRTKMGAYLTDIEMNFIFRSIDKAKNSVAADLGAEAGRFSIPLAKSNLNVIAIDMSVHGLKRLRLKTHDVNTVVADARAIPLKDSTVDTAVIIEVVHCIPELEQVLAECWRILKHGGSFVLAFGNTSSLKGKVKKFGKKPYFHSYSKVIRHLDSTGFRIVRREGFNWLPFNRNSENPLIPSLAKVERLFGLRKLASISPWILIHTIKFTHVNEVAAHPS